MIEDADWRSKFVGLVRAGNHVSTACRRMGVRPSEWKLIRGLGVAGETPYAEFLAEVEQAEAEMEAEVVMALRDRAIEDPRLAIEFLRHRIPERWDRRGVKVASEGDREEFDWSDPVVKERAKWGLEVLDGDGGGVGEGEVESG